MSHGKRYSAKERKEILDFLENHTYQETIDKYGVSQMSLARWVKHKKQRETNTSIPLIDGKKQEEFRIYLNIIEDLDKVKATAIVTTAGELILPKTMGFQTIFNDIHNLTKITSNLLLCAQGFTSAVVNDHKNLGTQFDNITIETPLGIFLLKSVKNAVIVLLFNTKSSLREIFLNEIPIIDQIIKQITIIEMP